MAKYYNNASRAKFNIISSGGTTTSSGPSQALTTQATDWENVLVCKVVIVVFFTIELLLIV
jgi:ABC-type transport system involved in multi-copper enzyme maturation permease subunit